MKTTKTGTLLHLLLLCCAALTLSACGIYSFTGTSIQNDVNTVTINYFQYRAEKVNPSLSNDLTEALRTRFRRSTRLEQVEQDGDLAPGQRAQAGHPAAELHPRAAVPGVQPDHAGEFL